jgi:dTDP-glucose 4,6-dehydratase
VIDNCEAIDMVLQFGKDGEVYNIGGGNELENIQITELILEKLNKPKTLIKKVADRLGHDRRYSVDIRKMKELGWEPRHQFAEAMVETVEWYQKNESWWRKIKEKQEEFKKFYQDYYKNLSS